jgi:hypothetical protein
MEREKHGLLNDPITGKKSRLYKIWEDMKSRCNNSNNKRYSHYGGRGIVICLEWNKYLNFHKWAMSSGYIDSLTIDRIDVNGNYCPENCKWATQKEQSNNRRSNVNITFNGVTKTQTEWAADLGAGKHLVKSRLKRGWSIERALTTPK